MTGLEPANLDLGKVALYQLSYIRMKCRRQGSNLRQWGKSPPLYQLSYDGMGRVLARVPDSGIEPLSPVRETGANTTQLIGHVVLRVESAPCWIRTSDNSA